MRTSFKALAAVLLLVVFLVACGAGPTSIVSNPPNNPPNPDPGTTPTAHTLHAGVTPLGGFGNFITKTIRAATSGWHFSLATPAVAQAPTTVNLVGTYSGFCPVVAGDSFVFGLGNESADCRGISKTLDPTQVVYGTNPLAAGKMIMGQGVLTNLILDGWMLKAPTEAIGRGHVKVYVNGIGTSLEGRIGDCPTLGTEVIGQGFHYRCIITTTVGVNDGDTVVVKAGDDGQTLINLNVLFEKQ